MPTVGISYIGKAESTATARKLVEGLGIANGKPQGALPPHSSFSTTSSKAK